MKKSILALLIGLTSASSALHAEDLVTIYQQALVNDPVVLKATAQYRISQEDIESVRSVLLPQINAFGGYQISESDNAFPGLELTTINTDGMNYGVRLDMQLYHHDSWLRLSTGKQAAHRSDLNLQTAKQDLILRVAQAYFDILSTKDSLVFATAEKTAIARQLEQTKQRFSVGLTAITDVLEAQAQYDNAVTEEIRSENAIYNAEEALRVITNIYPKNLYILNTDLFSTSTPLPSSADEWQVLAESKSLDLIAQKITVDIAKKNISTSRSGHYPTIDLNGSYQRNDNTVENNGMEVPDLPALDNYAIGINVNIPIYSGGGTSSAVSKAQQNYVLASQDLALTHRNTVRDTRNSYNTVIAAVSAIKALNQSVLSAKKALEATEAGFEVGTRTIVDVLDSTRNLYNAKRNLSSTRYAYIQSILSLKRSAGTITEQDILDVNKGLISG